MRACEFFHLPIGWRAGARLAFIGRVLDDAGMQKAHDLAVAGFICGHFSLDERKLTCKNHATGNKSGMQWNLETSIFTQRAS
jgi:hypothetical protein